MFHCTYKTVGRPLQNKREEKRGNNEITGHCPSNTVREQNGRRTAHPTWAAATRVDKFSGSVAIHILTPRPH